VHHTTHHRFLFEADALEVVVASKPEEKTENAFVGGRNRWRYDTFVNWEMWWPGFPVLVYFKVRAGGRQEGAGGRGYC
jgi:hypothetical protein